VNQSNLGTAAITLTATTAVSQPLALEIGSQQDAITTSAEGSALGELCIWKTQRTKVEGKEAWGKVPAAGGASAGAHTPIRHQRVQLVLDIKESIENWASGVLLFSGKLSLLTFKALNLCGNSSSLYFEGWLPNWTENVNPTDSKLRKQIKSTKSGVFFPKNNNILKPIWRVLGIDS